MTLWSSASGRVIGRPITTNPPGSGAQSISFSPDSERIAVPGVPGTVGIWDVGTGRRVGEPLAVANTDVGDGDLRAGWADPHSRRRLRLGDDGRRPNGTADRTAALGGRRAGRRAGPQRRTDACWPLPPSTGRSSCGTRGPEALYGSPLTADKSPVAGVVFSPDGRTLVTSHLRSAVAWDLSGRPGDRSTPRRLPETSSRTCPSAATARLAAGRFDGSTVVYDSATRRQVLRIDGGPVVTAVAFQPDGEARSPSERSTETFDFRFAEWQEVGPPLGIGKATVWQVAFSPDGRHARGGRRPERRRTGSTASSGRARCSSGASAPGTAWGGRSSPERGRCCPSPSITTARCSRPRATAGGSTSGMWPPIPTTAVR